MTTTNAPASGLLGQAKAGAWWTGTAMVALAALYWLALVGMRSSTPTTASIVTEHEASSWEWGYVGHGEDVSTTVYVAGGTYDVHWFGACPATVTLVAWDGIANVTRVAIGTGAVGDARVPLYAGDWYADVTSACDWGVRVSPT